MVININKPLKLFRYDINEPPRMWDSHFHARNTQYSNDANLGDKNKGGFYFLFDNDILTKVVASIICKQNKQTKYWYTKTEITESLSIIDLSQCRCTHEMLDTLESLNVDIIIPEMKINGCNKDFSIFMNHQYFTRIEPNIPDLIEVGWLGQILTDFDNGPLFKRRVNAAGLKIDGYRWCENINPFGLTYCLFMPNKLAEPTSNEVQLNDV